MERNARTRKIFSPISLVVLGFAFATIWYCIFVSTNHKLKVVFLDVGQGDSSYIEFSDGKNALIDGGPDKKVLEGLGREIPFYKRKVDIIFSTHPDADHLSGLIYVVKNYDVGRVVLTDMPNETPEYREFISLIKEKRIPITKGYRGTVFDFSNHIKISVLYPDSIIASENTNEASEILYLDSGKSKALFTGDLEKDDQEKVLNIEPELKADVIKVPHHGSKNSFLEKLYSQTKPRHVVISCGLDNQYGHPHREVLDFFYSNQLKFYRTDKEGDIEFIEGTSGFEPLKN